MREYMRSRRAKKIDDRKTERRKLYEKDKENGNYEKLKADRVEKRKEFIKENGVCKEALAYREKKEKKAIESITALEQFIIENEN